jgi:hypothetical protein
MKTTKIILSVMVAFLFIVLAIGSGDSNDSDEQKETKEITDCSKSPDDYHDGYSAGKLCKIMGDRSSCETFVMITITKQEETSYTQVIAIVKDLAMVKVEQLKSTNRTKYFYY